MMTLSTGNMSAHCVLALELNLSPLAVGWSGGPTQSHWQRESGLKRGCLRSSRPLLFYVNVYDWAWPGVATGLFPNQTDTDISVQRSEWTRSFRPSPSAAASLSTDYSSHQFFFLVPNRGVRCYPIPNYPVKSLNNNLDIGSSLDLSEFSNKTPKDLQGSG